MFEANPDRVGGRCWSAREFVDGQVGEHGGEFIDTDHVRIRELVGELGLELEDRAAVDRRAFGRLYVDGRLRTEAEVFRGYETVRRRLAVEADRIGYFEGAYRQRLANEFDAVTAQTWIDANVPGGGRSLVGQAMSGYLGNEFGADAENLSAINLFYVLEGDGVGPAATDGSDERFHVRGGNDQVPRMLAEGLGPGQLEMDAPLEAMRRRDDGSYELRFGGVREDVVAAEVVLAIPFTTLRDVDLSGAGLSALKLQAIEELGMGSNSKLLLQLEERPERYDRWNGELGTDDPVLSTWETSLTQPGDSGLITVYAGGSVADALDPDEAHAPAAEDTVREALAAIDRAVPGVSEGWNGRAWLDDWASDPWVRGSYAAFGPGQLTRFQDSGAIARPEGGVHFCGEHTAIDYQGFLEGAVETGERCAREIARVSDA